MSTWMVIPGDKYDRGHAQGAPCTKSDSCAPGTSEGFMEVPFELCFQG